MSTDQLRNRAKACFAALGLASLAILLPGSPAVGDGCRNPEIAQNYPDPDVLADAGDYYLYATNDGANVQLARSRDLQDWEFLPDALPRLPAWAEAGRTWAPEVSARPDGRGFVMYFTALHRESGRQCIGAAVSATPAGPFDPVGAEPMICPLEQGGAIDAAAFLDSDGRFYLLWKNDGNCCGLDTWIWIQELSADGLRIRGKPAPLIRQDQPWEGDLVEAPTLWKHSGRYYLFYSANAYSGRDYAIGYATADRPLGPYKKAGQLLGTRDKVPILGPGGQDVVANGADNWLVYHSWSPDMSYRGVRIDPLDWHDGAPVIAPGC